MVIIHYYSFPIWLLKLFQLQQLRALSVISCVPVTYPHHLGFWELPYSLAVREPSSSSYTFRIPTLESAIFPKNPCSCSWKIVIETNWALGTVCNNCLNKQFAQGLIFNERRRVITQVRSPEPPLSNTVSIWPPSVHTCGQRNWFIDNMDLYPLENFQINYSTILNYA